MQLKFTVTGMTCAACSARVEKVTREIEGVQKAEVNLLGGTMTVEAENAAVAEKIVTAVTKAGYGAAPKGAEKEKQQQTDGEETFVDNIIMYEVLSELKDIASRPHGITCACGSEAYGMEIRRSAVDLICRTCGAKMRIPAATDRDLDDLCCHMKLTIPGKA